MLSLRQSDSEEDCPVSNVLPSHLADAHHQVRMLVAMSVERWVSLLTRNYIIDVILHASIIKIIAPEIFNHFLYSTRLFLEITPEHPDRRKMLPLKHQQAAFENLYLKTQEGMRPQVRSFSVATGPFL